ncbi:hypothetical protein [Variovorax paradoxus]|uniref:Polysaccharide biosynthesis protein n=1 Tax=Variovorax paradoxus (strain EPS) TaxID=595537 RepID=E6UXD1_VARPE|nr:hypothetical protein [Variovorax paradoxus]ADU38848.1 hypothetical protein Varpa_4685 [Variovorax paradoxus EPS]
MKAKYIAAIFLQALAPLMLLGFSLVIAHSQGVDAQGAFAAAKSWFDLLVAFGCFGFPQSSILAINREGASPNWLFRASIFYSCVLIAFFGACSYFFQKNLSPNTALALSVGIGASSAVLVNIWRGVALTLEDGLHFHLITVLPTVSFLLIASIGVLGGASLKEDMALLYGVTAVVLVPAAYLVFPRKKLAQAKGTVPRIGPLITSGTEVFLQAISNVFQMFFCLWLLRKVFGLEQVGYFSLCLMLVNAFAFPLQALSPIILNKWSKHADNRALVSGARLGNLILIGLFFLMGLFSFGIPYAIEIFGSGKFVHAAPAMQVAVFILIPTLALRMDGLRLSATGNLRFNSILTIAKCTIFALSFFAVTLSAEEENGARAAMFCWLFAEVLAAAFCRLKVRAVLKKQVVS